MAWNEPGGDGNKPRDPWGGGDQGPPDLDEAMRKLRQQLAGIFGGGSGGGSTPPGKGLTGGLFLTILAIAAIVWGLMGFYTVDEHLILKLME